MQNDEQEIRNLVTNWLAASKAGDIDKVLSFMTDDVVFLLTGQSPMSKADFAVAAQAQAAPGAPQVDASNEIQEIQIIGDWAFMWQKLRVAVSPLNNAPPIIRAGHTLTIFRKQDGVWLLARDANMLALVSAS